MKCDGSGDDDSNKNNSVTDFRLDYCLNFARTFKAKNFIHDNIVRYKLIYFYLKLFLKHKVRTLLER
jgi:hypothetical protein